MPPLDFPYTTTRKKAGWAQTVPVTPGLVGYYRYRRGITLTDGAVSAWHDYSSNSHDLLQATASNRPTMLSDGTIVFDGADNYMAATFTLIQPATIYLLFKQISWTLNDVILDGVTAAVQLIQTAATPGITANAGSALTADASIPVGSFGVACFIANSTTSVYQAGSGGPSVTTTGDAGANDLGGITLGAARTPANYANIGVRELLVYNLAHDATTRLRVLRYLAHVSGSVGGI
jgi:hypothetical protein